MWKTVRLGDIANIIAGQSPKGENYNKEGLGMPFYQGKKDYGDKFLKPPTVWTKSVTKIAIEGDVIMSVRAPVGALNIATEEICIGRGLAAIRVHAEIDKDYLFYALSQISDGLTGSSGAIFNSINKKQIESIEFLLPPFAEQQRIVAKLDAAFAEIDKALNINEKYYVEFSKVIEKSQNNLFTSGLKSVVRMKLGDVAKFENGDRGKNYPSRKYQLSEGIPFVNAGDFSADGNIEDQGMVFLSNERYNLLGAGKFQIDDILFCLRGSLGKSAINKNIPFGAIASSLVILRAKKNIVLSDYLFAFIRSDIVKKYILETATGTAQPNLSAKVVSNYEIPVPPLDEQEKIIEKFWTLRQKGSEGLNSILQKSIQLKYLKSSILSSEIKLLKSEAA